MEPAQNHSCQTVTDVGEFSSYWYRCHLFGDVITMNSFLVLAEIMACQGTHFFLANVVW